MTKISIFRTSFIWVETVPAILAGKIPVGAPYGFLGQYGGYAQSFDACQAIVRQDGKPESGSLSLPWTRSAGNFYWKYYFEGLDAGEMTGAQAWKKFVPFQLELACKTLTAGAEAKVTFDAFYAPQGIAVIARLNYRGQPKSELEIAKLALTVRYDYRFAIDGSTVPAGGVSLDQAAARALKLARERGLGGVEGFPGDGGPFSVTTFLKAEDVSPLAQGSDTHFLLETVTGWNRHLKTADLAKSSLADAQLSMRAADDQHVMYARDHGRAIWLPREFVGNTKPMLACYHRNIMHASLQTLSLGEFVSWVAAQHEENRPVAPAIDERAKRAASLLQLFSKGETPQTKRKVTYRSASLLAQIEDAGWANAITLVQALP